MLAWTGSHPKPPNAKPQACFVLQVQLAAEVCRLRKLSPEVAKLFVEGAPSEVVLPNCTQLEEPHMHSLLRECSTPM